ncbi:hypothetical protein CMO83_00065 [Candidatus Woesearchaeota archaeon]|jgi:hypothetical protein|nr:hypothetical protein [Candidatus Woesearchaeota archaeon]|tara:strand:+ start:47594 stop:47998 length:405 start_codon:yes stop_codon:yes gene_type:complete
MGLLGKLAFWKKSDDLGDIGKDLGLDKDLGMGQPGLDAGQGPSPDLGMGLDQGPQAQPFQKYPSFQPQPGFQQAPSFQPPAPSNDNYINSKNMEVISSKLDALRVSLDSINQRLSNIEAIARGEQEDSRKRRYY